MNTSKREKLGSGLPVCVVTLMFGTVLTSLVVLSQPAPAAELAGGGIQVQDQDVAQQDMQDIEQEVMSVADVAGDADLTLIVPVEIENLYLNVDQGKILCSIRVEDGPIIAFDSRDFDIVDGAYSNTFQFYFSVPVNENFDPANNHIYVCSIALKDSAVSDIFQHAMKISAQAEWLEDFPAWARVSDESNMAAIGPVDW